MDAGAKAMALNNPHEHRWPRHLPRPSSLLNRGDSTPIELFLEGVRVWEPGIRRLLSAGAVSKG